MQTLIPESNKKPGVSYAVTDDGIELPVIDITHATFSVSPSEAELAALTDAFLEMIERQRAMPPDAQQAMRQLMETSIIGRGLLAGAGTFLTGVTTYLMKLGPENLGAYAVELDRQIAAALPFLSLRMRLQDVVRLQAEALAPVLAAAPGRPLRLLNIAGGPAIDSLNTLIMLRQDHPTLLDGRPVAIRVFDRDEEGPHFGARALDSLRGAGGKLNGLNIAFERVQYDWRDTTPLTHELASLNGRDALWLASSEGGLFEYGSDEEIVANLTVLSGAARPGTTVVGSVTRGDGLAVTMRNPNGVATVPRSLDAFTALAERGGWAVDRVITGPLSFNLRLVRG
jgi:hypothetical protein